MTKLTQMTKLEHESGPPHWSCRFPFRFTLGSRLLESEFHIGLPMGLTLSLLLLATCLKTCRKNPENIPNMANIVPESICSLCNSDFVEDQNEDYGVYYSAGQRVEIESEVRDNNEDYEATAE